MHTYVSREMLKHIPKPTTWDWGAGVATYSQVCLPAETAYSIMAEVKGKIHSPPQGCSHLLNTLHCSARLETGMNRHVNQASWAGLQRSIYDDVMKTRAVALESDCTIETQQHSRENHCGAYSRIRESNSFKPWEAVAVEIRAGRGIGGRLLATVSAALFEDSYGPFEWTKCKCASKHDPHRMHTVDVCSFTPYGYDIVRSRAEISCSFVATALIGLLAALFEDSYGPFEWTK